MTHANVVDRRIWALVERLAADDPGDYELASGLIGELVADAVDLREMAVRYLVRESVELVRRRTLIAEREASRLHDEERRRIQREREAERKARCEREKARRESDVAEAKAAGFDDYDDFRAAQLDAVIEAWKDRIRMEWTAELLGSTFVLRDGIRVTWGDATVEQHQQRVEMFQRNAAANIEGAARHRAAIDELSAAGCRTLAELTTRRAVAAA